MGVTGLWRLIEPAGKPVPVETLENKVLAVDISIWLHQIVKGYQDAKGAPLPNAHLIGLFQRLCKLLYFRIKPVFVFDGGFPELKKETIGKRQDNKAKYNSESERLKREIALLLGKKTAIGTLLGKQIPQKKNNPGENDDMFKLPALPEKEQEFESESEDETTSSASSIDLHTVDLESDKFKNLPVKDKYDLLVELKETRKMNSWGKLHTLPKKSDNFSDFQMERLLKRRKVQECLEETEKEMGEGGMSMKELESLLNEEGIDTKIESLPSRRIASNETTRYVLISSVKQALAEAKKKNEKLASKEEKTDSLDNLITDLKEPGNDSELEADLQKAIKMSLECMEGEPSASSSKTDDSWTSNFSDYSDSEDEDGFVPSDMSSAKAYIMQYSDFTQGAINDLVTLHKRKEKEISQCSKVDKIIKELNEEKSVIEEKIELCSSEDDFTKNNTNILIPACSSPSKANLIIENNTQICDQNSKEILSFGSYEKDNKPINILHNYDRENVNIKKLNCFDICDNEIDNLNINDTQTSIIVVEKKDEVILLDSSCELKENIIQNKESESSDDDFEEVPESDNKSKAPHIQLTLNMDEEVKDDIFADLFNKNIESKIKPVEEIKNWSENTYNKNESKDVIKSINELLTHSSPNPSEVNSAVVSKNLRTTPNFEKSINEKIVHDVPDSNIISKEKLSSIVSDIENKEEDLLQEKGRLDRIGRNITEQMTREAQELLQIFGIPYIVAPMEAEAQCAFLESIKLTDGTITDDSDIWLFGGQTVYKNFFNQKKLVLQYLSERIEKSFNLNREHLILLALLVGSDYTTGITGVGPVTALEILSSFPFNKKKLLSESTKQARYEEIVNGLIDFKKWVKAGKRTDNISLKKKLKNVNLTDDFPSIRVVQAYLDPNIEKSEEKFTWGELDITILRDYTKAKFGWSQNKLDEIIKPVLKRMQDRKNQKTVHDYFKRKTDFQSLEDQMSKRVKAAVQKMGPHDRVDETQEKGIVKKKIIRKRKISKTKDNETNSDKVHSETKRKKDPDNISNIPGIVNSHELEDKEQKFNINLTKTQRIQEVIPQREKDKQSMLQNKLKAIEAFRKTKIDRKTKTSKRRLPQPKDKAELSESSDTN